MPPIPCSFFFLPLPFFFLPSSGIPSSPSITAPSSSRPLCAPFFSFFLDLTAGTWTRLPFSSYTVIMCLCSFLFFFEGLPSRPSTSIESRSKKSSSSCMESCTARRVLSTSSLSFIILTRSLCCCF